MVGAVRTRLRLGRRERSWMVQDMGGRALGGSQPFRGGVVPEEIPELGWDARTVACYDSAESEAGVIHDPA